MGSIAEERDALGHLVAHLRDIAVVAARALRVHRDSPAGQVLDRQLEHTLDRLASLYGRGRYENLSTADIVTAAVENEVMLAAELDEPDAAAAAAGRARSIVDAARRGVRLHVRDPAPAGPAYRGVYLEPFPPELERSLWSREEPYVRWGDGAVLVLDEDEAAALRAGGSDVDVLFLDPEELADLQGSGDRQALEAEVERRLAAARAAPGSAGDSRDRYLLRLLHAQSIVLRNLRDRLATEGHRSAHSALAPVLAGHRAQLEARLAAQAAGSGVPADPLDALADLERGVQALAVRWAGEPGDPAGLRGRFRAVADAGTQLAGLGQYRGQEGTT